MSKQIEILRALLQRRSCSLLFLGPMTKNTVDVAIEIAGELDVPIGLIASRRQVEAKALGGGYVNGWTTESFAEYVRALDPCGRILIARDHGGPWQGGRQGERELSADAAMASAKLSYQADIEAGFGLIHIDPNKEQFGRFADLRTFTARTIELIDFCVATAEACGRPTPPAFEICTDEGAIASAHPEDVEQIYATVRAHCEGCGIAPPDFMVIPTGTLVKERRNVGTLEPWLAEHGDIDASGSLARLLAFCHRNEVLTKEHNADYLSDRTLEWHVKSRIDAVNVAPQMGVTETVCFVEVLRSLGLSRLLDAFVELALKSSQWERWLIPGSAADELERAIISGHYVFGTPEFGEIKAEAVVACAESGLDLEESLRNALRNEVLRQIRLLSLVPHLKPVGTKG